MTVHNNNQDSSAACSAAPASARFSLSFCNIRGMSTNLNQVHQHLLHNLPHVLFLTETKIGPLDPTNPDAVSPHLQCPGYELFPAFLRHGGLCAFIRSDVQASRLKEFEISNSDFQLIWFRFIQNNRSKFVCALYRSPNSSSVSPLFDHLSLCIEQILASSPSAEICFLGDFNAHNSSWLSHSPPVSNAAGREAEAFAIINSLEQLISDPTRVPDRDGDRANTLDLFLTSHPAIYQTPSVSSPLGLSDHCLITLTHDSQQLPKQPQSRKLVFFYDKTDWDSLRDFYATVPWASCFSDDPNSTADQITEWIQCGIDSYVPSSFKPGRPNSPKWFTADCQRAVLRKNQAFHSWLVSQSPETRAAYISARNSCSRVIDQSKKSYVEKVHDQICNSNPNSFWSLAKSVTSNFCHSAFPTLQNPDGSLSADPQSKADTFAKMFSSNSTLNDKDKVPKTYPHAGPYMPPIKFSVRRVRKILQTLNAKKSNGPDNIPAIVLKRCAPELAPVLNKLFKLSYTAGIFPSSWKLAHVVPIPKKGDKSIPSNYRPVALTSQLSKVMEAVITEQLLSHLELNFLLSDHQYGFRKARSTGDLLAYASHIWSTCLDQSGESRVIALDISKAFDRVWHCGLIAKLHMFGLHQSLISWISDFLHGRSIAVRVDGFTSAVYSINAGVPQGSVISPTLFLIFINDLLGSVSCPVFSFADDTSLSSGFDHPSNCLAKRQVAANLLNDNLSVVSKWGVDNLVTFNSKKTEQMFISRKRDKSLPPVAMEGSQLEFSDSIVQLGIRLTSDLSWKAHINDIAKRASQKLGFLFRSRNFFEPVHLLQLYKAQIRPQLEYCSHVWGGAPATVIGILDRIQSKAIRLIGDDSLTSSLQSLAHRRCVAALTLFYRYFFGDCSLELKSIVPRVFHSTRLTRSSSNQHRYAVCTPRSHTVSHSSSFIIRTARLWNALPSSCFPLLFNPQLFKSSINKLALTSLVS